MTLRSGRLLSVGLVLMTLLFFLPAYSGGTGTWVTTTDTDWYQGDLGTAIGVVGEGENASIGLRRDLFNWIEMGALPAPESREGPGMCFSPERGTTILFGGYGSGTYWNDTWEYNYSTDSWSRLAMPLTPPPRERPGMACDIHNHVVVVFGGFGGGGILKDTWELDLTQVDPSWTKISAPTSPAEMFSSPMVYDTVYRRVLLVGQDFATQSMETWAYDALNDTWENRIPPSPPDERAGHAVAYNENSEMLVLHGGAKALTVLDDTWFYDYEANQWLPGPTGPQLYDHSMVYRSRDASIYLFGGRTATTFYRDTWKLSGGSWSLVPTPSSPPARASLGLSYHSYNDYVTMCCGQDLSQRYNDTWVLGNTYQLMGVYVSKVYDSGYATTNWSRLYFNATIPENTTIQFRFAASNSPEGPWSFVGPDGTPETWYNTSGPELWSGHDNNRYARFAATLISWDGRNTPVLHEVTISFPICDSPPYLVGTYPVNAQLSVPTDTCIWLNFSEPMKTTSVTVDIWYLNPKEDPGITFDWTWMNGDTTLRLCPQTQFQESRAVQVWVNGTDLDGNGLVPNPVNPFVTNPFVFVIGGSPPYIVSTSPASQETDVLQYSDVIITWNEPMNNTSVIWRINRGTDPGGWAEIWSGGNTVLTLNHSNPFVECDDLEFEILEAKDIAGKDFEPLMGAPNPWQFKIRCTSPYVVSTDPYDGQANVELNHPITVEFSEPMNPSTLSHHITPSVTLSPTWTNFDQTLIVNHGLFSEGVTYTYCIDYVEDKDAYPLLDLSYCMTFTTVSQNPYVFLTNPADGDTDVDPHTNVSIAFSEAMNTGSVTWTLSPDSPPKPIWMEQWDMDEVLWLKHDAPFLECIEYTFEITSGADQNGNPLIPGPAPNPWSFTTICDNPVILRTNPMDGETNVWVWRNITIGFSEPINRSAGFVWLLEPPDPGGWSENWSIDERNVTLRHSAPFTPNTTYRVTVLEAQDYDGKMLVPGPVPNPWEFTVGFGPAPNPYIMWMEPLPDPCTPLDTPIRVKFSKPMNTATVVWTIVPDPGGWLPPQWSENDTLMTLHHVNPFEADTLYAFSVAGGQDKDGYSLVPGPSPNPIQFKTCAALCGPPNLTVSREPPDSIRLDWDAVPAAEGYLVYESQDRFASFPSNWNVVGNVSATTLSLPGHLTDGLQHFYIVRAYLGGTIGNNSTMGVKISKSLAYNPIHTNIYWMSLPFISEYSTAS
ncbi:MAG: Ig-like domain-containing protein, partial [Thermoplasmata archaeon]